MRILLVDDDKNIRQTLLVTLRNGGHEVTAASSVEEALRALRAERFDFMLTDFKLTNHGGPTARTGIDLLRQAKEQGGTAGTAPVTVVMTAFASFENAVSAIQAGAFDYIPKPFSNAQLEHLLGKVQAVVELRRENERLRAGSCLDDYFAGQTSPAARRLEEFVRKLAPTDASVLLVGESGTGKTELARLIHSLSERARRTFVVVNCTTLAESLLESELFGHMRGAFTGAVHDHVGKLELAQHGTLLIDEIGDLSLNGQTRLLRFLQERVIERVGGSHPITLDVRVIAATNRNLEEAVKEGRFREDLYYRLNVFESQVVPLRYRAEDVPALIERFTRALSAAAGEPKPKLIQEPIMKLLLAHSWPGNIRELRNSIERIVLLSRGREIEVSDLPDSIRLGTKKKPLFEGHLESLEEMERQHIERVLSGGHSQERAAQILGITSVTLWRKRKQYGLP
jgi:DNA-binding NtrC family response regulator